MDGKNSMRIKMLEDIIEQIMSGKLGGDESDPSEGSPVEELKDKLEGSEPQEDPKSAKVSMLAIEADPKKKLLGL
jgi:hypothetical protein